MIFFFFLGLESRGVIFNIKASSFKTDLTEISPDIRNVGEYWAALSKILPSRQGLVETILEEGMCSDGCKELPSSSPALQEQALQHVVQYANSGFCNVPLVSHKLWGPPWQVWGAVLYPCSGKLVVAWDPLLQQCWHTIHWFPFVQPALERRAWLQRRTHSTLLTGCVRNLSSLRGHPRPARTIRHSLALSLLTWH